MADVTMCDCTPDPNIKNETKAGYVTSPGKTAIAHWDWQNEHITKETSLQLFLEEETMPLRDLFLKKIREELRKSNYATVEKLVTLLKEVVDIQKPHVIPLICK